MKNRIMQLSVAFCFLNILPYISIFLSRLVSYSADSQHELKLEFSFKMSGFAMAYYTVISRFCRLQFVLYIYIHFISFHAFLLHSFQSNFQALLLYRCGLEWKSPLCASQSICLLFSFTRCIMLCQFSKK